MFAEMEVTAAPEEYVETVKAPAVTDPTYSDAAASPAALVGQEIAPLPKKEVVLPDCEKTRGVPAVKFFSGA